MGLTTRLYGKRVGVVGFGRIGQAVARRLPGFDVEHRLLRAARSAPTARTASLRDCVELAAGATLLIVTLAGGRPRRAWSTPTCSRRSGPEGWLVNVSRGSTMDEPALLDALEQPRDRGRRRWTCSWNEPRIDARFLALDNVLLQPHHASGTVETRRAMGQLVRDNLAAHFAGRRWSPPWPEGATMTLERRRRPAAAPALHVPGDPRPRRPAPGRAGRRRAGPGQVLVRVGMGGICGSDLHYFHHGGFGTVRIKRADDRSGHEVAGTVAAVARRRHRACRSGDRVAVNPSRPCGACRYCLEGLPNQCLDMRFYGSAMRMPHVAGRVPQPAGVRRRAVRARWPTACRWRWRRWPSRSRSACTACRAPARCSGKRVLVSGCGPIGALAVAAARVHGAAEIVATDVVDEPLAIARAHGRARDDQRRERQRLGAALRADKGSFDVMLECSGNERALRDGLEVMRPRGVVVQLGLGGDVSIPQNMVVAKELSIRGSFRFHAEFALAVRLINEGRVDLRAGGHALVPDDARRARPSSWPATASAR